MSATPDISIIALFMCALLLVIPFLASIALKLNLEKTMLNSVIRMAIQLFLAGIFLKYLFVWNSAVVNIIWFLIMVIVAMYTVIRSSDLNLKRFALPCFSSLVIAILLVVFYINTFVLRIENILEAKYFIVIGGMLLGNSLRGNIVSITNFYKNLKKDEKQYLYQLASGASHREAVQPYLLESVHLAIKPILATMMTIGIVSIPGMMSGQLLGGSSPMVAIKYQITIMIGIFVSLTISVILTIFLTVKTSFEHTGILKPDVFRQ